MRVRGLATLMVAVAVACGGSPGPTQVSGGPVTDAPTGGAPAAASDDEIARLQAVAMEAIRRQPESTEPGEGLDRAAALLRAFTREAGGAREALGSAAEARFAALDELERAAIDDLVERLTSLPEGRSPFRLAAFVPAPLPVAEGLATPVGWQTAGWVFGLTAGAPALLAGAPRDAGGNASFPPAIESTSKLDAMTARLTLRPRLTGSRLEAEVEMKLTAPGPPALEETSRGRIAVDLCPDPAGKVPLELSYAGGSSLLGGGMQWSIDIAATGQVGDDARLADFSVTSDGTFATQPRQGAEAAEPPRYVQLQIDYRGGPGAIADPSATVKRASSQVDQAFAQQAADLILTLGYGATFLSLSYAEDEWTDGYCVAPEVEEVEQPSQSVDISSVTPFTAVVRHRFEQAEVEVPVVATLTSGTLEVTPAGAKVPAPALFRYEAPDEKDLTATVELETRSRRGAGKLTLTFVTVEPCYRVDEVLAGAYQLTATVCGLDEPFTIAAEANGTLGGATGTGTFTISLAPDGSTGTYAFDGRMTAAGGSLRYTAAGSVSVGSDPGGELRLALGFGNWTIHMPAPIGRMPLGEGHHIDAGETITLVPVR